MDEIEQDDFVFQMENLFRTIYMNQILVYSKFLKKYPNGSHQNEQIIHSLISDENNDDISILLWLQDLHNLKIPHQISFLYGLILRCPHWRDAYLKTDQWKLQISSTILNAIKRAAFDPSR
jgi:hypothetical protein